MLELGRSKVIGSLFIRSKVIGSLFIQTINVPVTNLTWDQLLQNDHQETGSTIDENI